MRRDHAKGSNGKRANAIRTFAVPIQSTAVVERIITVEASSNLEARRYALRQASEQTVDWSSAEVMNRLKDVFQ